MKCNDIIRQLSNYLDGELDANLVAEVQRHMEHCDHCRVVVDTTRKTISLFCGAEPAELPSDVRDRLHNALHKAFDRRLRNSPAT